MLGASWKGKWLWTLTLWNKVLSEFLKRVRMVSTEVHCREKILKSSDPPWKQGVSGQFPLDQVTLAQTSQDDTGHSDWVCGYNLKKSNLERSSFSPAMLYAKIWTIRGKAAVHNRPSDWVETTDWKGPNKAAAAANRAYQWMPGFSQFFPNLGRKLPWKSKLLELV